MYILPQSVHAWTALFGGISYSAWALLAYSCWQGLAGTSIERISKGKVPRFFCGLYAGLEPTAKKYVL